MTYQAADSHSHHLHWFESPEIVESPELFSSEEDITDTAYSDTSSDAEATLFTTKDYCASHKKLLSAKDLIEEDSDETNSVDSGIIS